MSLCGRSGRSVGCPEGGPDPPTHPQPAARPRCLVCAAPPPDVSTDTPAPPSRSCGVNASAAAGRATPTRAAAEAGGRREGGPGKARPRGRCRAASRPCLRRAPRLEGVSRPTRALFTALALPPVAQNLPGGAGPVQLGSPPRGTSRSPGRGPLTQQFCLPPISQMRTGEARADHPAPAAPAPPRRGAHSHRGGPSARPAPGEVRVRGPPPSSPLPPRRRGRRMGVGREELCRAASARRVRPPRARGGPSECFTGLPSRGRGRAHFPPRSPDAMDPDSRSLLCAACRAPSPPPASRGRGRALTLRPGPAAALARPGPGFPAPHSPGEMCLGSRLPSQDGSQALLGASVCPSGKWGQVSLLEGLLWGFKEKCREWVCSLGSSAAAAR